ncbi:MAG: hypothetical protein HN348_15510 [Proteobacteria bacterium]|nr:hypothetical protein [Pseudomonadota bacterium]
MILLMSLLMSAIAGVPIQDELRARSRELYAPATTSRPGPCGAYFGRDDTRPEYRFVYEGERLIEVAGNKLRTAYYVEEGSDNPSAVWHIPNDTDMGRLLPPFIWMGPHHWGAEAQMTRGPDDPETVQAAKPLRDRKEPVYEWEGTRLVRAFGPLGESTTFESDEAGRVISAQILRPAHMRMYMGKLGETGDFSPELSWEVSWEWDEEGRLIRAGSVTWEYDEFGNLTRYRNQPNGYSYRYGYGCWDNPTPVAATPITIPFRHSEVLWVDNNDAEFSFQIDDPAIVRVERRGRYLWLIGLRGGETTLTVQRRLGRVEEYPLQVSWQLPTTDRWVDRQDAIPLEVGLAKTVQAEIRRSSRDIFFDDTFLFKDSKIELADASIASFEVVDHRLVVVGQTPGETDLLVSGRHGSARIWPIIVSDTSNP